MFICHIFSHHTIHRLIVKHKKPSCRFFQFLKPDGFQLQASIAKGPTLAGSCSAANLSPLSTSTTAATISSDTSSSSASASHTPSPGCGGKSLRRPWIRPSGGEGTSTSSSSSTHGIVGKSDMPYPVGLSHDDSDSSDDSTYSSQDHSDPNLSAARLVCHRVNDFIT